MEKRIAERRIAGGSKRRIGTRRLVLVLMFAISSLIFSETVGSESAVFRLAKSDRVQVPGNPIQTDDDRLCGLDPELCRTVEPYRDIIAEAARKYRLEPELILAIIQAESGFDPRAVSPRGARGLMQLMPATARSLGVENRFDPHQNIMAGTRYFRQMLDRVDGCETLALAAYNAGLRNVRKHGGIPPYGVTKRYIRTVLEHYDAFKRSADSTFARG